MEEMYPKRKHNRLSQYDYSSVDSYFITICTKGRENILSSIDMTKPVGETIGLPSAVKLTEVGNITEKAIQNISSVYPAISVDRYVIMPNHIHLLLTVNSDENGRPMVSPTVSVIIQQFKGVVTKHYGKSIWQRSYHDHIVRNQADYNEIAGYICENPLCWEKDCFYKK